MRKVYWGFSPNENLCNEELIRAMWPGVSVSDWYFSHPDSKYFAAAQLQRDQVEDYARRKGIAR